MFYRTNRDIIRLRLKHRFWINKREEQRKGSAIERALPLYAGKLSGFGIKTWNSCFYFRIYIEKRKEMV